MKAKFLLALLFVLPLAAQTPITIQNSSFETYNALQSLPCSVGTQSWSSSGIPSWTGGSGTLLPCSDIYTSIPDGVAIAYTEGSAITQVTNTAVTANAPYTASVYAGHRKDGHNQQNQSAQSTITLLAGSTPLCSASVTISSIPSGTFQAISCNYTAPASPPSGNLTVQLSTTSGTESDFDLVSLTVSTPPPPHYVTLTWADNINPNGTKYNVYRALGGCPTTNALSILAANVATLGTDPLQYVDTTATQPQNYCYGVAAVAADGSTSVIAPFYTPAPPQNVVIQ